MILNALQGMGAAGKDAFVWWLVFDKGLPVLGWLVTFAGLCWLALKVTSVISAATYMAKLRDEMGIGTPGPLWHDEAKEVTRRVRELMHR